MAKGALSLGSPQSLPHDSVRWLQRRHFQLESLWDHVDFQVIATYDVVGDAGWRISMPVQPWCEFWLVRAGSVCIEQGEVKETARAGQVVFLRSGLPRKTTHLAGPELSIIGFSFHATYLGAIDLLPLLQARWVYSSPPPSTEEYLKRMVHESDGRQTGYPLAIQALGQLALVDLVRSCHPATGTGLPNAAGIRQAEMERVLQFIAAHFHEELSVEKLAEVAHLSPKHFGRKFRAALGLPPMDYVRRLRLARARELLCSTAHNVSHLALRCGFEDAAHFTRAFKREYHQTPSQLRRLVGQAHIGASAP